MNPNSGLDRQDFEAFLANAFAVQKSGLDTQSLSAVVEVQRFIATARPNTDRALDLIADCSLRVSNASGVAIARLESNQLIYCAAKGTADNEIGRRLPAVFSLCAQGDGKAEILRVEDAQTDSRIQAEVCRQFGAASLLILPICHRHQIKGILQVHFSEAHSFLDREVRAYRLMAGLAADAISGTVEHTQVEHTQTVAPDALPGTADNIQGFVANSSAVSVNEARFYQDVLVSTTPDLVFELRKVARLIATAAEQWTQVARRFCANHVWESQTVTAAIVLTVALTIAHFHHPVPTTLGLTNPAPSAAEKAPDTPASMSNNLRRFDKGVRDEMAPSAAFRRVRIGSNEVDYVANDVTIRYFMKSQTRPQSNVRFVNIGDDVTVRYFSNDSTSASQANPISTTHATK
jgi:hypothetical protein